VEASTFMNKSRTLHPSRDPNKPFQKILRVGDKLKIMNENKKKDNPKKGTMKKVFYPNEIGGKGPKYPYDVVKRELKDYISTLGKYKYTLALILEMLEQETWIDPEKSVPTRKKSKKTDADDKADEDEIFGIEFKSKVESWVKKRNDLPADKMTFCGHIKDMCHENMLKKNEEPED